MSQKAEPSGVNVPEDTFDRMVTLRRDLHQHPELSGCEERTADRISEAVSALGLQARRLGGTGLIADLPGRGDGPAVALRADTDALPLQEETGLPFASVNEGVMHACGHDGHSSMLIGAADLLLRDPPPRPVRLIWQPAEETAKGALAMISDGALEGVGMIFGGHVDRHFPPGVVVIDEGTVNASTDAFHIFISGQTGHGARPHEALDAVVVGSLLVMSIQTVVSREINPAHPSVISVGSFHAGTASNVIAGRARLEGTIRAHDPEVREQLHRAIGRIARAVGDLHGADVSVEIVPGTPPLINRSPGTDIARNAAARLVGEDCILGLPAANMGGEDFSRYLDVVPGCYVRFGAQVQGREGYPAHSGRFDFDERALAVGAAWFAEVAREAGDRLGGA